VVEAQRRERDGRSEDYYITRFLERLPLGTPYPAVAERVQTVIANIRRQVATSEPPRFEVPPPSASITLYVDGTRVGQPVVDLLKGAGVPVRPVYFTYGDRRVEQRDRSISLGKAWLVSRLQALLQTARIVLPKTMEARVLAQEDMKATFEEADADTPEGLEKRAKLIQRVVERVEIYPNGRKRIVGRLRCITGELPKGVAGTSTQVS
jgi:hypothetical protein